MESVRVSLERIMAEKGIKPTTLSQKVSGSKSLVKDILERGGDIRLGTLIKLALALDVDVSDLLSGPQVPILGNIGAGGSVAFFGDEDDVENREFVMRPPIGGTDKLMALRVVGDSMLPRFDAGDIVYVRRDHNGILPPYLGRHCAVALTDGGVYLKLLTAGTREGLFTLRSLNAADMVDQSVLWASPVIFVMPMS